MKIKSLEIYGYGQFIQRTIHFDSSFTEIYGENEAGKSTIQAFIHSILFGFPTRKESEPRLEPKLGNQYGGKLTLIQDDGSEIEIERIKGSATGDVKVYLPNGLIKDEAWLKKELNYISKRTYQGIFSFSVLGLQDIHKNMDETQLQNYLLQAGALGSTEFTSLRETLNERKAELYKKNGRKPIINQQLEQLNELELQIRDEEAKLTAYHRYVDDRDKAQRRLDHLKQNLAQLSNMHEKKQKEIALHDQAQEWKSLEKALNVEPIQFPEKGIDRYESAKLQTQSLKREIGSKEDSLERYQQDNARYTIPESDVTEAMTQLAQQEHEITQRENDHQAVTKEIQDKTREFELLKNEIAWQDVHQDVDSSDAMKSHVTQQLKEKQSEQAHIQQLEQSIADNNIEKSSNNEEISALEQDIVPEETFEKKRQYEQQVFELQEKNNLYQKMKDAFDVEQAEKEKKQQLLRISFIILAVVSLGLTIFAFVSSNIIFAVIFAILTLIFVIGTFLVRTKTIGHSETFSHEIEELEQQVSQLEADYDLDFDLDQQYRLREQWQNAVKSKDTLDMKAEHLQSSLDKARTAFNQADQKLIQVREDLYLSDKLADELIVDSISTINKVKDYDKQLDALQVQQHELQQQLDAFYDSAKNTLHSTSTQFNQSSLFHDVKQWLQQTKEDITKVENNDAQISSLSSELTQLKSSLSDNENLILQLFDYVDVQDEEDYYQRHEQYVTYQQNMARFNDLTSYLENQNYAYSDSSTLAEKTEAQLDKEDQKLAQQVDDYNEQYLAMQSEVSDLTSKIEFMETDETLANLRHRYHMLKNQMNDEAKDWASLSYLQSLVDAHITQIKDKRLPQVIDEATDIFKHLTEGRYVQITYANDELMVKQYTGQMYRPVELSQSTKEILYVALRLSLIKTLKQYYPFPVIIDDAFVHFDKNRKTKIMDYLREMPDDYQILYFTCVKDTTVPAKQIVTLNKLEEGGK